MKNPNCLIMMCIAVPNKAFAINKLLGEGGGGGGGGLPAEEYTNNISNINFYNFIHSLDLGNWKVFSETPARL